MSALATEAEEAEKPSPSYSFSSKEGLKPLQPLAEKPESKPNPAGSSSSQAEKPHSSEDKSATKDLSGKQLANQPQDENDKSEGLSSAEKNQGANTLTAAKARELAQAPQEGFQKAISPTSSGQEATAPAAVSQREQSKDSSSPELLAKPAKKPASQEPSLKNMAPRGAAQALSSTPVAPTTESTAKSAKPAVSPTSAKALNGSSGPEALTIRSKTAGDSAPNPSPLSPALGAPVKPKPSSTPVAPSLLNEELARPATKPPIASPPAISADGVYPLDQTDRTQAVHSEGAGSNPAYSEDAQLNSDGVYPDELTEPENSLSEDLAPSEKEEETQELSFLGGLVSDSSWFFQKKKTKHKMGIVPYPGYSTTQGFNLGLRFLSYSSSEKGYYLAVSGSKYISNPYLQVGMSFISDRSRGSRIEASFLYDNSFENDFGRGGMLSKKGDRKDDFHVKRAMADFNGIYQIPGSDFYAGLGMQAFYRKAREYKKDDKKHTDRFILVKAFGGYDSRDNWKNPLQGAFHRLTLACKPRVEPKVSWCKAEGDFRFYVSLFKKVELYEAVKNSVFALRFFVGSSLFSASPYIMRYSLGGVDSFQKFKGLRGFEHNRFRGDRIYMIQSEWRLPLWKKYISGVLFAEMGEVSEPVKETTEDQAQREQWAGHFVTDFGGGLRIGLPPNYDMNMRIDFGLGLDKQGETSYDWTVKFLHAF